MKKRLFVAAILLFSIVVMVLFLNSKKSATEKASTQNPPAGQSESLSAPQKSSGTAPSTLSGGTNATSPPTQPENLAVRAGMVAPPPETTTNVPPAIILENVRRAIRQYNDLFGGDPVGTNPEITGALNGDNPRQINFIQSEAGMQINDKGELVDAWGTPLFFHQLSRTDMEIHSAGPDKKMWTLDDLVTK